METRIHSISFSRHLYFIILGVSAVVVYYPILNNQLLDFWDDQWVVMNYYTEGGFTIQNIWRILTEFYHGQYAPFNEYLYLVLYSIAGYNPFVFHLASLILHIVNTCLVFLVTEKLLTLCGKIDIKIIPPVSLITSLIFCVHPFNVESVAWMSASKVLVYALFYLLATYTFLCYMKTAKTRFYIYTLLLYVFSFLGKEQAVVFPLWMLLIYWLLNRQLSDRKVWMATLPFFLLSVVFGIITIYSQYADGGGFLAGNDNYPLWQRIVFACYAYLEYLFKITFPFKLSYLYPFPSAIGDPLPNWLLVYPAVILIIAASLWTFIRQWPVAFGLLFFTVHIAIALHIIPLSRFAIVADRYAYLAVIGIGFILAYYGVMLYNGLKKRSLKLLTVMLFAGYLLYFGIYAHQRTYTWYDTDALKKELRELLKQRNDYHLFYPENE
ncbi:hypothetical protein SAMN05216357_101371 [Porphyromonadaceae bacterium KH3CP3RA]|nr:hypothetical protein SAMN05216357_101371 [Porphyromonadaceae bacterium KH3CP3RA]